MRELLSYSFIVPPTIFIVICLAGAAISLARPRIGAIVTIISASLLYLCATPLVSTFLIGRLEALVPSKPDFAGAQAIVVLGGDEQHFSGTDDEAVGQLTLERLEAAAELHRRTGLPILVSGGTLDDSAVSLARLMQRALTQTFLVPVKWVEDKSLNTFQNALYSAKILENDDIRSVIVVTQAWHMPRALLSFNKVGLHAVPFCYINSPESFDISDILPSASAFQRSFYAFHEIIGLVYYHLAY